MTNKVPEGWTETTIEKILSSDCLFSDGDWVESKDQDPEGNNRLVQLADIGDGRFLDRSHRFMNDEQFKRLKCTALREGDILVARMPDPIGRAAILPNINQRAATVVDVAILRPTSADNYWLMSVINSSEFRKEIEENSTGTTRTRIGRAALSKIRFLSPPLPEQKKIASILTSVDDVIENTQKQIEKLQDLKKATMNELLTKGIGHTEFKDSELGRIPKSWEVVFGNEVFKLGGGNSPSSIHFSDAGGVLFMKVEDFNNIDNQEKIKTTALKFEKKSNPNIRCFPADTIVIAKRGAAIMKNRVKLFAKPTSVDSNLMTIQVTAHNPKFFTYYLTWENLSSLADTTSVPQLNNFHLYEHLFRLPPLIEQNEIVAILSAIDERSIRLKSKLSQIQSLKKSLMQDLLTGKVRVQAN